MKGPILYVYLVVWLFVTGLSNQVLSQAITTSSVAPVIVCPGGAVTVSFVVTGTFSTTNVFTAQLSDASGTFPTSPVSLGTRTGSTGGTISGNIPGNTTASGAYLVRVVSNSPARTGTTQPLTIASTSAPGTSPPAPYCENDTPASLSANPSAGGTLNWYGTNPTGGTRSGTATLPSTNVLGNTSYYVSQTANGCEGPRAAIIVTVKAKPAAPGTSPVSYCAGQPVNPLSATPSAGGTLNWYGTNATGGTASPNAPIPAANTNATYYVSQTVNGCESARAGIAVTFINPPAAPTATAPAPYCQGAIATPLTATGQNLKWYGSNATGGTASGTPNTPDTRTVGSMPYYVSQTVNGCEGPRTAITVQVKTTPAGPTITPPPAYCQNQPAAPLVATPATGGTLNWYGTSASGGNSSSTFIPGTTQAGITPYYVSQTLDNCEGPRASIGVTVKPTPAAPTTTPVIACLNRLTGQLSASPSSGGSLNWYGTSPTGGTASGTAPTPPSDALGGQTYYVSQTVNGCESPRASLTVTVNAVPAPPAATAPVAYCEGSNAQALSATGQSLKWYGTNEIGGTASSTPNTPGTGTVGTATYYVTQTVSSCESARASIAVRVKDTPDAPGTASVDFCQGTPPPALNATLVASASPNWFGTNAGGGTPSGTAPTPGNTTVGTTTYYISQTLDGCEGPRASLNVRVKETPGAPGVSRVSFCNNSSAQPLTANGSNIKWFEANGNPLGSAPTPGTGSVGDQVFKASQTTGEGCEGPKADLVVTVNAVPAPPAATAPVAYCEGSNAQALSATGQSLKWYGTNEIGGTASSTPNTPGTGTVGTATYYVTQTVSSCESARASIAVRVKDTPDAPGTASVDFCQGTPPPALNATLVASASPNWFGTNAGGGTPSGTAPTPGNTTVGITTYYISQTLDGCEGPRASLNVRVKETPGAPGVSRVSFCNNSSAQPLTANGSNIKWFEANGNPLESAPTPGTGSVGDQVFKASQTTGEGCEGPKADLVVTIKPLPSQPGVTNLSFCQVQTDQPAQNVSALRADGQNLRWFNSDGSGLSGAPVPFIDRTGVQSYQVSQTVDNCEGGRATLQVTINTTAAPVVTKPVVTYCINDKATPLEATIEPGATAQWRDPYNRLSTIAHTPSTLNTNIDPAGDAFFVYQIGQNGCYSARSTIRVVVNTTPTLSLIAPVTSVNLGLKVPLKLTFTGSGPYSYTIAGGYSGTSRTSDTTITVLPRGNTTYQVTAVTNGCGVGLPGNPATAVVMVLVPTVATGAVTNSTLCAGTSLTVPFTTTGEFNPGNTFRLELVSSTDTTKKYDVPATANTSPVSATLPITIPSGQYAVRVRALNPDVGIMGTYSATPLTVRSLPTATLTGSQSIYEGTPASLTIAFGGDGPWNLTYADSVRSYSVATPVSPFVTEVRPARTTTYRIATLTNSCGNGASSGAAVVTVLPLLGIVDNSLDPLVKAYPVPTNHAITVELDLPLTRDPAELSLIDSRGRAVLKHATRSRKTELDVSTYPGGFYILRIEVGNRHTVRRIIKL